MTTRDTADPVPPRPGVSRVLRQSEIPEAMAAALLRAGVADADILAAFPTDLSPGGQFVRRWLVVDRLGLTSVGEGGATVDAREPFCGLTALEYRRMIGGGVVVVKRHAAQRELARCSRATDRAVQTALAKLRTHLELDRRDDDDAQRKGGDAAAPVPEPPAEPPPALPEISPVKAALFLKQLAEMDEQRYCATCGLPLRRDTAFCPVCTKPGRTLLRVLRLALPYRRQLLALAGIIGLISLAGLVPPLLNGRIFDRALVPVTPAPAAERFLTLLVLVGGWVAIELLLTGLHILQGRTSVLIGSGVSRDLRARVFNHLQRLSLGYFDRHKTGALMTRVSNDTQHLENFLVDGVVWSVISIAQAVLVSAMLFWINWRMGILILVPAPLVILYTRFAWKRIMGRYRRLWEVISRLSAVLNDSLRGVRVVKAFGREAQEIDRFDRHNQESFQARVVAEYTWAALMPVLQFVLGVGAYLVWIVGGALVIKGFETPGALVAFMGYMPMLYGPLRLMTQFQQWFPRSMPAAERVFEVLDTESDVREDPAAVAMPAMRGRIELQDIGFGYEKHSPVIRQMSLAVEPGEVIGLAGHSGAGKSTTINLIARLYDVDTGRILIDGVDIRTIRMDDLRRQIGVVLQETFLFAGTVFENIAYGRPRATPAEVIEAAKLANAHDFIMDRCDGYDSEVEEGGNNFSIGEKQRLAIARAILHDPRILILDEATSSVDSQTEQKIQEAIVRLTRGRTTIAIAHRLSTLRCANRLVVMDKGRVAEVGTHEELLARKGVYHGLVKTQAEMTATIAVGV